MLLAIVLWSAQRKRRSLAFSFPPSKLRSGRIMGTRFHRLFAIALLSFLGGLGGAYVGHWTADALLGARTLYTDSDSELAKRFAISLGCVLTGAVAAPIGFELLMARRV
jgi:hypothetical protein